MADYTKIATHFRPDADALLSVWAAKRLYGSELAVGFVSAAFGSGPDDVVAEDVLYVDLSCGIKEVEGKLIEETDYELEVKRSIKISNACQVIRESRLDGNPDETCINLS